MLRYNSRTGEWEGKTGGVDVVELSRRKAGKTAKKNVKEKQNVKTITFTKKAKI